MIIFSPSTSLQGLPNGRYSLPISLQLIIIAILPLSLHLVAKMGPHNQDQPSSIIPMKGAKMKRKNLILLATITLFVFSSIAFAMHHEIKIAEKEGIGKYITDTEGKTLYWFKKDPPGTSACSGACIAKWPVYFRDAVAPPEGISKDDFGTINREDGNKQTTFRGYPLYYWVGDVKAGDTTGQGVNNVWFVVNPENFPLTGK
jgi:predicted lipoprotein with Yx(FWY)xxD motif